MIPSPRLYSPQRPQNRTFEAASSPLNLGDAVWVGITITDGSTITLESSPGVAYAAQTGSATQYYETANVRYIKASSQGTSVVTITPFVERPVPLGPTAISHGNGLNMNLGTTNGGSYSSATSALARQWFRLPKGCTRIKAIYPGWVNASSEGDTAFSAAVTVIAGVETVAGVTQQVTINESLSAQNIPLGAHILETDWITVPTQSGDTGIWWRTLISGTSGNLPANMQTWGGTFNGVSSGVLHEGLKLSPSTLFDTVSDSPSQVFGPLCLVGEAEGEVFIHSLVIHGDSKTQSTADWSPGNPTYYPAGGANSNPRYTDQTWAQRLVVGRYGQVPVQHSGYGIQKLVNGSTGLGRMNAMKYGTTAVFAYGINDLTNGRTAAQVIADLTEGLAVAKGMGLTTILCTLEPNVTVPVVSGTSLPDARGFITGSGIVQTATSLLTAAINTINAWARTYPANVDFVLDIAGFLDPDGTNLWPTAPAIYHATSVSTSITTSGGVASFVDPGITVANGAWANPSDGYGPYAVFIVSDSVTSSNNGRVCLVWDNQGTTLTVMAESKELNYPPLAASASTTLEYYITDQPSVYGIHELCRWHQRVAEFAYSQMNTFLGS